MKLIISLLKEKLKLKNIKIDIANNFITIVNIMNNIIDNNVEIGNNNCIDRAVMGSTIIGENVKIDNLVHNLYNFESQILCQYLILINLHMLGLDQRTYHPQSNRAINP